MSEVLMEDITLFKLQLNLPTSRLVETLVRCPLWLVSELAEQGLKQLARGYLVCCLRDEREGCGQLNQGRIFATDKHSWILISQVESRKRESMRTGT